jgi:hypothetical protein
METLAPELNQKLLDASGAGPLFSFSGHGFPAALDNRLEIELTSFVKSPLAPLCQRGPGGIFKKDTLNRTPPPPDAPLRVGLLSYRCNPHSGGQGVYV